MATLKKALETRHVNMIALGGSIGTGIFLASGYSIATGGPGGALFSYILISIIVYFLMTSLGEMSVHCPSSGSLCDYGYQYVGESYGFAMGYNYWLSWAITVAAEISAASLIMAYWFPNVNSVIFSITFFILILLFNIFSVRLYGEVEYFMSFIKVAVIIVFIICGILIIISHPATVVTNFTSGDAPFHNGFLGIVTVFLFAGYSFQGTELIGVASGETKDPSVSIPKAVKLIFWRISLFYILSIFIISALFNYSDAKLLNSQVLSSPYTLLFAKYIGRFAGDVINFIILIALLSAANASIYSSSRIMWFLGNRSKNKVVSKLNKHGTPTNALLFTALFGCLAFLSSFIKNGILFTMLVNIASISCFVAWVGIAITHYKFRVKFVKQNNINLIYKAKFYPYAQVISIIVLFIIILSQFLTFTDTMTIYEKISIYAGVLPFIIFYLWHKIFYNKAK
ncbi:MAG: Lysine-specific permease [Pseudomonadota bacterium]|nr:amino acid permease [Burkholderiales bacterium]